MDGLDNIHLPAGTILKKPIEIVCRSDDDFREKHSHRSVVLEEGAQATLIEIFDGKTSHEYLNEVFTEIKLGLNARLEHIRFQREPAHAFHEATISIDQARDSFYRSHNFSFGSKFCKSNLKTVLAEGAEAILNGLFIGSESQQVENYTLIDHSQPHGSSQELYKGVLSGKARGVFEGTIRVRPDAQKIQSLQMNKNLLLSDDAKIDTKPMLEIYADDVKCNHGATIGRLDAEAIFYLRSRGIGEGEAKRILTFAFARDILSEIKEEELRGRLERVLMDRLMICPGLEEAA